MRPLVPRQRTRGIQPLSLPFPVVMIAYREFFVPPAETVMDMSAVSPVPKSNTRAQFGTAAGTTQAAIVKSVGPVTMPCRSWP